MICRELTPKIQHSHLAGPVLRVHKGVRSRLDSGTRRAYGLRPHPAFCAVTLLHGTPANAHIGVGDATLRRRLAREIPRAHCCAVLPHSRIALASEPWDLDQPPAVAPARFGQRTRRGGLASSPRRTAWPRTGSG